MGPVAITAFHGIVPLMILPTAALATVALLGANPPGPVSPTTRTSHRSPASSAPSVFSSRRSLNRPRLWLSPREADWARQRCGTGVADSTGAPAPLVYASHIREFRMLKRFADENVHLPAEPGGLYPVAFVHLVSGQPTLPDEYTRFIDRELAARRQFVLDFDDVAAALDWCWSALDPRIREKVADALVDGLEPLRDTDDPFDHFLFHPRLCHLAAAVALRDVWAAGTPQAARIDETLQGGRRYFHSTLVPLITQLRGTVPTPDLRANFEADMVLAAELVESIEPGAWAAIRAPMHDAFDVYFWSDTQWPSLSAGVFHDSGTSSPLVPGQGTVSIAPGVADVVARRTQSPIAAYYAAADPSDSGPASLRAANRLWMHLLHDWPGPAVIDREHVPHSRRLGNGWLLMRSDWEPGATLLAFDAVQPTWVSRQHLDAGQFQVIRKARLAIDSGDDVSVEAGRSRGGEQHVGEAAADFDLYASATLAHNCIALVGPREVPIRVANYWLHQGSQQRPVLPPGPPPADISKTDRVRGRLIAFESNDLYSFASTDLAKAYGVETALLYERSILMLHAGLIVIVDRLETANPQVKRFWMLHLPAAPTINGEPLDPQLRRRAEGANAGTWSYPAMDSWLSMRSGDGRLFVRTILPTERRWQLVGGPAETQTIPRGEFRGRTYLGSSARGFEYWLTPASLDGGANAWYRLGAPVSFGNAFGAGGGWGRLEVEATAETTSTLYVNVLVPVDAAQESPPPLDVEVAEDRLVIKTKLAGCEYVVRLAPRETPLGRVEVRDAAGQTLLKRALAHEVAPDRPLPAK